MTRYNWEMTGPGGCDTHCIEHPCGYCLGAKRPISLWKRLTRKRSFTIGNYDIELHRALRPWSHFARHRTESGWHFIWGRISFTVENWTLEVYPICAMCGEPDISERSAGDESWTVCTACRSVEQGYRYINKREYDSL